MSFSYWRVILPACFLLPLITITNVLAKESWQQTYENGVWDLKSNKFKCSMSQNFDGVADVYIVQTPEYKARIILKLKIPEKKISLATLKFKPADWKNHSDPTYQSTYEGNVKDLSIIYDNVAGEALNVVAAGDWLDFELHSESNSKDIIFTNLRGVSAVTAFQDCVTNMAPMSWESARDNEFFFEKGSENLSSELDLKKLKDLVSYIHIDNKVTKVLIDGYTDNVGDRIANRQLSQQRADEIASRLVEFGLKPSQLEVRAHGSRYPVINNDEKGNGLNRRVSVRLIRKDNGVVTR
ncbi:OmpA family protein [Shewanella sp. A32]|uniref:OmpA family protein n=1 Tax=Shewanella sp. A32 TaxID=3031327 RepID=UPI0023B9EC76|nr:OmpA family protein [Shewanella sp. A32]MDF0535714.1 OmpA family protein [Shewanella sp. A32]